MKLNQRKKVSKLKVSTAPRHFRAIISNTNARPSLEGGEENARGLAGTLKCQVEDQEDFEVSSNSGRRR